MKRGLAPLARCSALPITRRRRFQLSRVAWKKSLNRRAGLPVSWCSASAQARSMAISSRSRLLRARPKEVIDALLLAPGHQLLAGEAGVGAEQDPYLGPAPADAG